MNGKKKDSQKEIHKSIVNTSANKKIYKEWTAELEMGFSLCLNFCAVMNEV